MIKKRILILLLLVNVNAFCQSSPKLDSMWSVWQDVSKHDTIRADAFGEYIWAGFVFVNPDSAIILAKKYYNFTKTKNIKKRTCKALYNLGIASYFIRDYNNGITYFLELLEINKSVKSQKLKAYAFNGLGLIYTEKGNYNNALKYYLDSYKLSIEMKDTGTQASCLNNLAMVYSYKGDYKQSIKKYFAALKLYEIQKDSSNMANCYNNIAIEYNSFEELDKALNTYKKSLNIYLNLNLTRNVSTVYSNMGNIYLKKKEYEQALKFYRKGLDIAQNNDDEGNIAKSYGGLGNVYAVYQKYDSARVFMKKSLQFYTKIGDRDGMVDQLLAFATLNFDESKFKVALQHYLKALKLASEIEVITGTKNANEYLWKTYKKLGDYKNSLKHYESFIQLKDSINSEENIKEIINQEYKYAYEKQAAVDSITHVKEKDVLDANIQKQALEIKQKRTQQFALFGGVGLLLVFGGFMYNRFKVTKKQKGIIEIQKTEVEAQKQEVEEQRDYAKTEHKKAEKLRVIAETQKEIVIEKSKEIMDSITYAKRLQNAILPPPRLVKEWLTDSFIFYKPKDIVAGDFYWMEVIKKEGKSIIFYAAADCTGHGVPGAMVSVVCSNALNRSIKEFNITDPAKLLDKVTELVKEAFDKSDEVIKDGMDIAICALDLIDKKVWFSGANNPLYRITDLDTKIDGEFKIMETENRKLVEYKADKQPVGEYEYMKPFTTTEIQLEPGDCLYIFSDGFSDQFGGEKGKKYKSANFKRFLMQIENKEMDVQKEILDTEIERWRGEIEQVDDICVIGLRVNGLMSKIFTKRELEVLKKVLEGKASKNIADELFISKHTVDTHRKRILAKTNAKNVVELTKFCDTHGVF